MKKNKKMILKLAGMVMLLMLCMGAGKMAYAQTTITPPMLKADGNTSGAASYQFELTGDTILTVPISVSQTGKICFEATYGKGIAMVISKNADAKASEGRLGIGLDTSIVPSGKMDVSGYAEAAGTYYMHAFIFKGKAEDKTTLTVKAYQIPAAVGNAGTLSKGKWVNTSGIGGFSLNGKPAYFKIKVPSSGCVKVEVKQLDGADDNFIETELTNSKKKGLSDETDDAVSYYGVNKGTYYVKVDTDRTYKIRYTFKSVKNKKNTSKKKAVSLKKKKTVKGLFLIKQNKSHWYKLTLKKAQTLKLTFNADTDKYGFSYTIRDSEGNPIATNDFSGKKQFKKKLKAGTYYLDIYQIISSGSYSVKWN